MEDYEHIRMLQDWTLPVSGIDGLPVVLKNGEVIDSHARLTTGNMNSLIDLGLAAQAPAINKINITYNVDIGYCIGEQCTKDGSIWKANKDTGTGWTAADWDIVVQGA